MRSHDLSYNKSNVIGTILYHKLSQGKPFKNHLLSNLPNLFVNFPNQSFKLTSIINLFIELATLLACDTSLPLTNVRT